MKNFVPIITLAGLLVIGAGVNLGASDQVPDITEPCRICVLTDLSEAETLAQWAETAHFLTRRIHGYNFEIVPAGHERLHALAEADSFEFAILNPALYIHLEKEFGAAYIATLERIWENKRTVATGGVVFMKAGRPDIESFSDLRGKSLACKHARSFGGWYAILREFKLVGINPEKDLASVRFYGTSDSVAAAVASGACDAGALTLGSLEQMAGAGKFDLDEFRTIPCPLHGRGCPLGGTPLHSTRVYPGWAFARTRIADVNLSKKVAKELLSLEPDDLAAITGQYSGWTIPLSYNSVSDCLREIKAPPFEKEGRVTVSDLLRNYWKWLIALSLLFCAMASLSAVALALNRGLARSRSSLQSEVQDRIAAEESIKNQAQFLQKFLDAIPDPVFYKNSAGSYEACNKAFETFIGLPRNKIIGFSTHDFAPRELADVCVASDMELFETGGSQRYELPVARADGETRVFLYNKAVIETEEDGKTGIVCVIFDITELKRVEAQAQEKEIRYRTLFESSQDAMMTLNPPLWKFTQCNRAALEMFMVESLEEFALLTPGDLSPEYQPGGEQSSVFAGLMIESAMREGSALFEWTHRRRNGQDFPATVLLNRMEIMGETFLQATARDITQQARAEEEKRRMETEIQQSQKLQSVGVLAAGVAHEINTPMQFIGDNIKFMQNSIRTMFDLCDTVAEILADGTRDKTLEAASSELTGAFQNADLEFLKEEMPSAIEQSITGIEQVSRIVKALKDFSNPDKGIKMPTDINRTVQTMVALSKTEWKNVCEIETSLAPDLPEIDCIPGEINQVLLNLIVNAAHAISDVVGDGSVNKGLITITTGIEDGTAAICITDTGPGIPTDVLPRIFEPFFTTKKQGQGGGQGLSIAHGIIVQKHGGIIDVETEPGKGTKFIVRLPLPVSLNLCHDTGMPESEVGDVLSPSSGGD